MLVSALPHARDHQPLQRKAAELCIAWAGEQQQPSPAAAAALQKEARAVQRVAGMLAAAGAPEAERVAGAIAERCAGQGRRERLQRQEETMEQVCT